MAKLNQIVAVEKGNKNRLNDEITKTYHAADKPALLTGLTRTYQPKQEDGEQFPSEATRVQTTAFAMLAKTSELMTELWDLTLTKDTANCQAHADVVLPDGTVLLQKVPVSHLLFLEKQMTDLHTIFKKIPTLDPSKPWHWDSAANCYATEVVQTVKTKKVPRNHQKAKATEHHPEQVEVYHEDVVVGTWSKIDFSGAMPAEDLAKIIYRVELLKNAVTFAREQANSLDVVQKYEGKTLFNFLLDRK